MGRAQLQAGQSIPELAQGLHTEQPLPLTPQLLPDSPRPACHSIRSHFLSNLDREETIGDLFPYLQALKGLTWVEINAEGHLGIFKRMDYQAPPRMS